MSNYSKYFAIIDSKIPDQMGYKFLYCANCISSKELIEKIYDSTHLDPILQIQINIYEQDEAYPIIPDWFIKWNNRRYVGEAIFKLVGEPNNLFFESKELFEEQDFEGLKFGLIDYSATGEGVLYIYYCSTEQDVEKFKSEMQKEMKIDDYFMIGLEILKPDKAIQYLPSLFLNCNIGRINGFSGLVHRENYC
ncbi:MAG: hypothetical protein ACRCXZ_02155 [Patescibacteria group bacterium]